MTKQEWKRVLPLVLLCVIILSTVLVITATADTAFSLLDGKITVSSNGTAEINAAGDVITATATPETTVGCTQASTNKITITNNTQLQVTLRFTYTYTLNGGSVQVGGSKISSDGSSNYEGSIAAGKTVTITLTSSKTEGAVATLTLSDFSLSSQDTITVAFTKPVNGTATVDGYDLSELQDGAKHEVSAVYDVGFQVTAVPADGYEFACWYDEEKVLVKSDANGILQTSKKNCTVTPLFVPKGTALFGVDKKVFDNWDAAVEAARSSKSKAFFAWNDATLPAGEYTVPAGITFLVPFDAANTLYTTAPGVAKVVTPSTYRTLTLAEGVSITVDGAISVGSNVSASGTGGSSKNGTPTGPHGKIQMREGSTITLNNSANLYAWGYIAGDGTVTAESGATVYECFQNRNWRGGSATTGNTLKNARVFPFSQYYVQNIETKLVIKSGATEKVSTAVVMQGVTMTPTVTFIGSDGMFRLGNGATVTKQYLPATDQLVVDVDGDIELASLTVSAGVSQIKSSDYVLPINSNIAIRVHSGTTTITQQLALLPGAELRLDQGANIVIASNQYVVVYDEADWGPYAYGGGKINTLEYTAANGTATKNIRTAANLKDAKVDINGTVTANGYIYTTANGAEIISSEGTGLITFKSGAGGETTTHQAEAVENVVDIKITPAQLQNADKSYTKTADWCPAGAPYIYKDGKWQIETYTITWQDEDGSVLTTSEVEYGKLPEYPGDVLAEKNAADIHYNYTFVQWAPEFVKATEPKSYQATFEKEAIIHTAIWMDEDKEVHRAEFTCTNISAEEYSQIPTKADTDEFTYKFDKWDEVWNEKGDVTYTAVYEATRRSYTITWVLDNGEEPVEIEVEYGTVPKYPYGTPTKAADAQYTYTFDRWDEKPVEVTGPATYTAIYTKTVRTYTITWLNDDGKTITTTEVEYGKKPVFPVEKFGTPVSTRGTIHYKYTFTGWGEIADVTGEASYTAQYDEEHVEHTATWVDENQNVHTEHFYDDAYPEASAYTGDPKKKDTPKFHYERTWERTVDEATGDITYTAKYEESIIKYTITWKNDNGDVLTTTQVPYDDMPSYPTDKGTPTSAYAAGDIHHTYTFTGWKNALDGSEIAVVTGDAEYIAKYEKTAVKHTAIWLDGDGEEVYKATFEGTTLPKYEGDIPTKKSTEALTFTFSGEWEEKWDEKTGDVTLTAKFKSEARKYKITWYDENGTTILATSEVAYGEKPTYPENGPKPTKASTIHADYEFAGWSPALKEVDGETSYKAVYIEHLIQHTAKWVIDGETKQTAYFTNKDYPSSSAFTGSTDKAPTVSTVYKFLRWDENVETNGDITYTAVYESSTRKYKITWLNDDGVTVLAETEVEYDALPEYPFETKDTPVSTKGTIHYKYTFRDFGNVVNVTGEATYTAQYDVEHVQHTATWVDEGENVHTEHFYDEEYPASSLYTGALKKQDTPKYHYERSWERKIDETTGNITYTAKYDESIIKYKITWLNDDGKTVLATTEVEYDALPEYPFATNGTPVSSKEATDIHHTYKFLDFGDVKAVTGEATYTAQYTYTYVDHSAKWVDENGKTWYETTFIEKNFPDPDSDYEGETPTKEATVSTVYTFAEWVKGEPDEFGNITYTAKFSESVRQYKITWYNDGGVYLTESWVDYGTVPSYPGAENPTKASTIHATYEFKGWTPTLKAVDGDFSYTAEYTEHLIQHTATWVIDGKPVYTKKFVKEEFPGSSAYTGSTEKAPTVDKVFTFEKWEENVDKETGNITYTAVYTESARTYTITWLNDDDQELRTDEVEYGEVPNYGDTSALVSSKAAGDIHNTYSFANWDKEPAKVEGDAQYKAVYAATPVQHTATWVDEGENVHTVGFYDTEYPEASTYTGDPKKQDTAEWDYERTGWERQIDKTTGDITYTAVYSQTKQKYTITFTDEDGKTLYSAEFEYGTDPVYKGEKPTKDATKHETYAFKGWTPALETVKGTAIYKAVFDVIPVDHTATWYDDDGQTELDSATFTYTKVPAFSKDEPTKEANAEYTYTFEKWNEVWDEGGNVTYTAVYTATKNKYVITWYDEDGEKVLATSEVEYGAVPKYPYADPTKAATIDETYQFKGWDRDLEKVTGATSYKAQYTTTAIKHTATWYDEDGESELYTDTFTYKNVPEYKGKAPTKADTDEFTYTFEKWDEVWDEYGNVTYTAVYKAAKNKYTVTWYDEDGKTVLAEKEYKFGETPVYPKADPTKASTVHEMYEFAGWDRALEEVTCDTSYKATYKTTAIEHTATWVSDGKTVHTEKFTYTNVPAYDVVPTKEGDAQYSYAFKEWTKVTDENGDVTFTAVYTSTVNKYTITWYDEDGKTVLAEEEVEYGVVPKYPKADPTKAATIHETYAFKGWDKEPAAVTGNANYTATYETTAIEHTATWVSDGKTVHTEKFTYTNVPAYDGIPTKEGDAQYSYTFKEWKKATAENGDVTFTATFTRTVNVYTITWYDEDGETVLATREVEYGIIPAYPKADPTKASTIHETYTFAGWDRALELVTGDTSYKATYKTTAIEHTATWVSDGKTVHTEKFTYTDVPAYDGIPTKEGTAQYSYTFKEWKKVTAANGDVTFTAVYTSTVNKYTVTWYDEDGETVLATREVEYGIIPAYPKADPTKASTIHETYTFAGWDRALELVTGDASYIATYKATAIQHTATWVSDGETVHTAKFTYTNVPAYDVVPTKEATAQYTYTFKEWKKVTAANGDVTFTAVYTFAVNKYTVTWYDEDGKTVLATREVEYGIIPAYPKADPAKPSTIHETYVFAGWDRPLEMVTGDASYIATYKATAIQHTATWVVDGETVYTATFTYEDVPAYDGAEPTKAYTADNYHVYRFAGWKFEASEVTGDVTYTAVFETVGLNGWITEDAGITYLADGEKAYKSEWATIDGNDYYFDENGYIVTGLTEIDGTGYVFDENGVFLADYVGIYEDGEDTYWVENGQVVVFAGLVKVVDENGHIHYYYFDETNKAVKDGLYQVVKTNGLALPAMGYDFDENGVIIHDEDTSKNGWIDEEVGGYKTPDVPGTYSYIDGILIYEGLIQKDGAYYYVTSAGMVVKNAFYWVTKTNGLLPEDRYEFDEEGKLITKREIRADEDGLYYYENNIRTYAGLILFEGDYYYVRTGGALVCGQSYWVTKTNGLLPEGSYEFDADGKMIFDKEPDVPDVPDVPEEPKNGIVAEEDGLYYYEDGVRVYAGLILIDGDYYYVRSNGALVCGQSYWVTKTNGLLPEGSYEFDADGKMIFKKNGIIEEDGELYYYVDGVRTYAGLILIDGNYYYVRSNGALVRNQTYWVTKTNGLLPEGNYKFGADGKMIIEKNGIIEEDGELYYYVDGVRTYAGLILIDGDYYYVRSNGALVRNQTYWVTKTNGLLPEGSYTFGADGKMIRDEEGEEPKDPETPEEPTGYIVAEDGSLYYYENGVRTYAGLIQLDGDYYYVKSGGEVVHGRTYWVTKTNGLLPEGNYTFADDGKMILN